MEDATRQVIEAVKPIAAKIGEGAAHLYEIYVRQMVAEAWATLIGIALATVFLLAIIIVFNNFRRARDYNDDARIGFALVQCAATAILFCTLVFGVPANVMKLSNPEYYAIERIICQAKGDNPC